MMARADGHPRAILYSDLRWLATLKLPTKGLPLKACCRTVWICAAVNRVPSWPRQPGAIRLPAVVPETCCNPSEWPSS